MKESQQFSNLDPQTYSIHSNSQIDGVYGSVSMPIYMSSTFRHSQPGKTMGGHLYTRLSNPTRSEFEEKMALIEKGQHAIAFSSGNGAFGAVMMMISSGDHVVISENLYSGILSYLKQNSIAKNKISVDFINFNDHQKLRQTVKPETQLIWFESPSNPLLIVFDIKKITSIVQLINPNIIIGFDNTFASPVLQNPLTLGVDIVLHSCTKFIGGHSDIVMGVLVFKESQLYNEVNKISVYLGACPSPFDCFLAIRGLQTLFVRVPMHCSNALNIAKHLQKNKLVKSICYPGLKSHPSHQLAKTQMKDFGGMVSFVLNGNEEQTKIFLKSLKIISLAVSLGGTHSIIELSSIMSMGPYPMGDQMKWGVSPLHIRMSVGLEHSQDLIDDINQALNHAFPSAQL